MFILLVRMKAIIVGGNNSKKEILLIFKIVDRFG
jgi:hypothetical protein